MTKVSRSEILTPEAYDGRRAAVRALVLEQKRVRRVHVGPALTFLFENADTVRYQIQEMVRAEGLRREADVQHEVDTYNELLGAQGDLGCTLLIEIADPAERDEKLRAWKALPEHLYVVLGAGRKVRPTYDQRQIGEDRLSSVQYLKFDVGGEVPAAVGCDLPGLSAETRFTDEQRAALERDLRG